MYTLCIDPHANPQGPFTSTYDTAKCRHGGSNALQLPSKERAYTSAPPLGHEIRCVAQLLLAPRIHTAEGKIDVLGMPACFACALYIRMEHDEQPDYTLRRPQIFVTCRPLRLATDVPPPMILYCGVSDRRRLQVQAPMHQPLWMSCQTSGMQGVYGPLGPTTSFKGP